MRGSCKQKVRFVAQKLRANLNRSLQLKISKKTAARRRKKRRRSGKLAAIAKHEQQLAAGQQTPMEPWYGPLNSKSFGQKGIRKEQRKESFPLYLRFGFEGFKSHDSLRLVRQCERLYQHLSKLLDIAAVTHQRWPHREIKRIIYTLDFRAFQNTFERRCRKRHWIPSPFRQLLGRSSRLRRIDYFPGHGMHVQEAEASAGSCTQQSSDSLEYC